MVGVAAVTRMNGAPTNSHWYRVAAFRPRLAAHARIARQAFRGTVWYVLTDTATGRHHRFNESAQALIGLMDGERTIAEIWQRASETHGDDAPTQDETLQLLGQLHTANLLRGDLPPDTAELFRRHERERRRQWRARLLNPLSLRFPLFDPDRPLERALPFVRPLFGRVGAMLWLAVVGVGALLALKHLPGIVAHASERALAPANLLMLWLLYPVVKLLHEFGHAIAVKARGGAVHEMGVLLLVLTPTPYVDASAATAFPDKRDRMLVSATGVAVELLLTALALFMWLLAQPGWLRDAALDVMLIGGLSTLFFNGNPLLRFDGYYVLADAIGIPGLAARSARYYGYLAQRYLCGLPDAQSPVTAPGERGWFACYGFASFWYRMAITLVIVLFLSSRYFAIGAALAIWAVATQIVYPLIKAMRFVALSPVLHRTRRRAALASLGLLAAIMVALVIVPLPLSTRADGVLWLPEQAQVRARADGFVTELLAADGAPVKPGDALVRLADPDFELQLRALEAERRELETRYYALRETDLVQSEVVREELRAADGRLARMREQQADQVLRAQVAGTFVVPEAANLPDRFVKQGEPVAYVVDWRTVTARVVVPQSDVGLIRRGSRAIVVKPVDAPAERVPARLAGQIGGAVERLPSRALGTLGGGRIEVDPRDEKGLRTRDRVFEIELTLAPQAPLTRLGSRVIARFDHGFEPVAFRLARALKREFLRTAAE
jgi:putative peptide zinc metalloprotease protein